MNMVHTKGNPDSRHKGHLQKKLPAFYEEPLPLMVEVINFRTGEIIRLPREQAEILYKQRKIGVTTKASKKEKLFYVKYKTHNDTKNINPRKRMERWYPPGI